MAKVVLGDEFDTPLRKRIRRALQDAGGKLTASKWGVGGSQELHIEEWRLGGAKLVLEAETYMGLSLTGPEEVLGQITGSLGQKPSD